MNPHQKNKVDISSLTPEEQRMFRMYGRLPNKKDLIQNKLKQERKYFDSGDYALSKAGKAQDAGVVTIGSQHPSPDSIPHSSSPQANHSNGAGPLGGGPTLPPPHLGANGLKSGSPVKESSFLARQTSVDDVDTEDEKPEEKFENGASAVGVAVEK